MPAADPIVGIDLGTSNTVIAHADGAGGVRILSDEAGFKIHPSVVSFHPSGGVVVGAAAKQRKVIDPANTIYSVKRLIGRPFSSPEVQSAKKRAPYQIKEGANQQPMITTRGGEFAVPEISAIVLDHVRNLASVQLDAPVQRAVVTVPASFNDAQRSATATAGAIAGLTIVRVLNEPTAAALAYGHSRSLNQTIAVYDFGGGTFDITILRLQDQVYEVLGTAGESFLGGDDLDERLVDKMVERFLKETRIDLRSNEVSMMRLRAVAEQTKIELSRRSRAVVRIDEIAYGARGAPLNLQIEISRDDFVGQVADIIDKTFPTCKEALNLAQLGVGQIDDVILVGGTTKIPYVRDQVSKFFARAPRTDVSPEEAIAAGASLQATSLDRMLTKPQTGRIAAASPQAETAVQSPFDTDEATSTAEQYAADGPSVTRQTPPAPGARKKRISSMPVSEWDDDAPSTDVGAPHTDVTSPVTDVTPPFANTDVRPPAPSSSQPIARMKPAAGIAPMKQVPARSMFDVPTHGDAKAPAPPARKPVVLPPKKRPTMPPTPASKFVAPPDASTKVVAEPPSPPPPPQRFAPDAHTMMASPSDLAQSGTAPGVGPVGQAGVMDLLPAKNMRSEPVVNTGDFELGASGATASGQAYPANLPRDEAANPNPDAPLYMTQPMPPPPPPAPRGQPPRGEPVNPNPDAPLYMTQPMPPPPPPAPPAMRPKKPPTRPPTPAAVPIQPPPFPGQPPPFPGQPPPYAQPPPQQPPPPQHHEVPIGMSLFDETPMPEPFAPPPQQPMYPPQPQPMYPPQQQPMYPPPQPQLPPTMAMPPAYAPPFNPGQMPQPPAFMQQPMPQLARQPAAYVPAAEPPPAVRAPVILDVTPRGLGIGTVAGFCEELIRRNSRVPTEIKKTFSTSRDSQESVRIVVCQGESRRLDNNIILGDLHLLGLPARPRGETSIEVTFSLNASGILEVRARDAQTGAEQRTTLDLVGAMPQQGVDEARERIAALRR